MSGQVVAFGQFERVSWMWPRAYPRLHWPAAEILRAADRMVHILAGLAMGAALGAVCGNVMFWLAAGAVIGRIYRCVAAQSGRDRADVSARM